MHRVAWRWFWRNRNTNAVALVQLLQVEPREHPLDAMQQQLVFFARVTTNSSLVHCELGLVQVDLTRKCVARRDVALHDSCEVL